MSKAGIFTLVVLLAGVLGAGVPSAKAAALITAITNALDGSPPPLAPGSIASIHGLNLAAATQSVTTTPLPSLLSGIHVDVNGTRSPLFNISPTEIDFQIPYGTAPGIASVIAYDFGVATNTFQIAVLATAPGLGRIQNVQDNYAINSVDVPASPGQYLSVLLTGAGAVTPAVADGVAGPISTPIPVPTATLAATINGVPVLNPAVSLIGGSVGLLTAGVLIPLALPYADSYTLTITIGGVASRPVPVYIAVPTPLVTQAAELLPPVRPSISQPLLFGRVSTGDYETEITISNTSQDGLGSTPQTGSCTLNFYGSFAPPQQVTSPIPPGRQMVINISQGGWGIAPSPGFVGYLVATCGFSGARGFARLTYNSGIEGMPVPAQVLTLPRNLGIQTNILFPFTGSTLYDPYFPLNINTNLSIANTSRDPFGGVGQSGTCTLTFYVAGAPVQVTTPVIDPGSVYTYIVPYGVGYAIANCNFGGAVATERVADDNYLQNNAFSLALGVPAEYISQTRDSVKRPLLFSAVSNRNGLDTLLAISNTTADPFGASGVTPASGTCTLNFYGTFAPASQTTKEILPGTTLSLALSSVAPDFAGYVTADCAFAQARGFAFDVNGRGTDSDTTPVEVITLPRNSNPSSLLFPAVTAADGDETTVSIRNTSADSYGSVATSGTCTINYFGAVKDGSPVPLPQVSGSIAPGSELSFSLSRGNAAAGIAGAPGFRGYLVAACTFPLARGLAKIAGPIAGQWQTGLPQTISFPEIPDQDLAKGSLSSPAVASSGLAVTLYSTGYNCTASGTVVTFIRTGQCTVTAMQAGDSAFNAASPVSRTFLIENVPLVKIDSPGAGATLTGTATISGSALEGVAAAGYSISSVAVLIDGLAAGSALYGAPRADVCLALPSRPGCPNVGWTYSLDTAHLAVGSHLLTVVATDASGVSGSGSVAFSVARGAIASMIALVTNPPRAVTLSDNITLTATLAPASSQGLVKFFDGLNLIGSGAIVSGQATLTTKALKAGTHSLRAVYAGNPSVSSSASTKISVEVQAVPSSGFQAGVLYTIDTPSFVTAGDFNGDGFLDLITLSSGTVPVSLLAGAADGTFRKAPALSSYVLSPTAAVTGDFNGDGKLDLAVASDGYGVILVPGNGDGTFSPVSIFQDGDDGAISIAAGDLNGDGQPDLITANRRYNISNAEVRVKSGHSDGTLQNALKLPSGQFPVAVTLDDLNNDGILDIVTANNTDNNLSVFLGNGDGTFRAAVNYRAGAEPASVVTADFNNDGNIDLAVANKSGGNVSILLGNGDGTFGAATNYAVGSTPSSVVVNDFDGDGKPDIAVANSGSGSVGLLSGNGDGTFRAVVSYPVGGTPVSIMTADFNGDGRPDMAVANRSGNNVSVLLGAPGTPRPQTITFASIPTQEFAKGVLSLVAAASSNLPVSYLSNSISKCTVQNSTVTFVSSGLCSITALQSGNAIYAAATVVTQSFNVTATSNTITFPQPADVALTAGPVAMVAQAISSLPVSYLSNTLTVCSVTGSSVSLLSAGTCSITATESGNGAFAAAPPVTRTFNVLKVAQSITFVQPADTTLSVGGVTLAATASSSLAVSYTSGSAAVCTVSGSLVTLLTAGICSVSATQPGNATYLAAGVVSRTFVVRQSGQTPAITLALSEGTGFTGDTVEIAIQLSSLGVPVLSTWQLDLSFDPQNLTFKSAREGAQLAAAGKTLASNAQPNGDIRLSVAGPNQNVIASGIVGYATFTLGASFRAGTVTPKACASADGLGTVLGTACIGGTVRLPSCDVNGDGNANVVDVQLIINEALAVSPPFHDLNHDGSVSVADVQKVINAALGQGCLVP